MAGQLPSYGLLCFLYALLRASTVVLAQLGYSYTANGTVWRCYQGLAAGLIDSSSCVSANATGINGVRGFMFTYDNNRVYMPNNDGNSVTVCDVQSDYFFGNCRNTGATLLQNPRGITFFDTYALIANGFTPTGGTHVTKCSVDAVDGSLSSCVSAGGSGFDQPWSIQATTNSYGNYTYIANRQAGNVIKCTLSSTATMSLCVGYPVSGGVANVNFAYVTRSLLYLSHGSFGGGPAVLRANVSTSTTDGSLSSFTNTGATFTGTSTVIGITIW